MTRSVSPFAALMAWRDSRKEACLRVEFGAVAFRGILKGEGGWGCSEVGFVDVEGGG